MCSFTWGCWTDGQKELLAAVVVALSAFLPLINQKDAHEEGGIHSLALRLMQALAAKLPAFSQGSLGPSAGASPKTSPVTQSGLSLTSCFS